MWSLIHVISLRASTYSSAGLTDIKNGIKTALGAQIGGTGSNFGGFDNGLGTAASLGGLGAVGAGLALGLAKASKATAQGKEGEEEGEGEMMSVRPSVWSLLKGL